MLVLIWISTKRAVNAFISRVCATKGSSFLIAVLTSSSSLRNFCSTGEYQPQLVTKPHAVNLSNFIGAFSVKNWLKEYPLGRPSLKRTWTNLHQSAETYGPVLRCETRVRPPVQFSPHLRNLSRTSAKTLS